MSVLKSIYRNHASQSYKVSGFETFVDNLSEQIKEINADLESIGSKTYFELLNLEQSDYSKRVMIHRPDEVKQTQIVFDFKDNGVTASGPEILINTTILEGGAEPYITNYAANIMFAYLSEDEQNALGKNIAIADQARARTP